MCGLRANPLPQALELKIGLLICSQVMNLAVSTRFRGKSWVLCSLSLILSDHSPTIQKTLFHMKLIRLAKMCGFGCIGFRAHGKLHLTKFKGIYWGELLELVGIMFSTCTHESSYPHIHSALPLQTIPLYPYEVKLLKWGLLKYNAEAGREASCFHPLLKP